MRFATVSALLLALAPAAAGPAADGPFTHRGYYVTLTRAPTFGLDVWKRAVDCVRADGGNVLVLWTAGGFRSKKFPATWGHNADHENVQHDFVRDLIDYAHTRQVKVLLGFTPFGYDGVNRMALDHPSWAATGPDGRPTKRFGIHCWGQNLCPAREDVQRFMLDYVREMYFDFYPNADGLLIESSDYAVCHCPDCGPKYYDHEYRFVRAISDAVWARDKAATVVVYPHYFTGPGVPGLNVTAARQPFDRRWTMFFAPHSARPDAGLIRTAAAAWWSDDAPALRTPREVRDGARRARQIGCSGYVPSLEAFSFVPTEPEEGQDYLVGKRLAPFGMGWLAPGQVPYDELPVRVVRIAYREYTRDPDLSDADFRAALGRDLFGAAATPEAVEDALGLQRLLAAERTWCQAAPLANPARVAALRAGGRLTAARRAEYRAALDRVRAIERRYRGQAGPLAELHRVAAWVAGRWNGDNGKLLDP
ncbi:MAG TPA: hypothetical protein VGF55_16360 [Gemmataceae bacterium]|jgi:hypothetical protein